MRRGLVAIGVLLALPASAHAGTVGRLVNEYEEYDAVWYQAARGERNHVTVQVAAKTVTIADSGAPITVEPRSGCTALGRGRVRCRRRPHVLIDLGDRNDSVRFSYSAPVGREFAQADAGAGDDTLRGGTKAETLDGGPGADVVYGGAGDDELTGGEGRDVLRGGAGNDFLNVHDYNGSPADSVACGRGRDGINYDVDPSDVVHRDCEKIASVAGGLPVAPTLVSRTRARYVVPFRSIGNNRSSRCTAHVVLTDRAGRLLAEGRGTMRSVPYRGIPMRIRHLRLDVRLTPLGQRLLWSGRRVVIKERVTVDERVPGLGLARSTPRLRVVWPGG